MAGLGAYCARPPQSLGPGARYRPLGASECAYGCGASLGGDSWATARLQNSPACARACAEAGLDADPMASALEAFVDDREYWAEGGEREGWTGSGPTWPGSGGRSGPLPSGHSGPGSGGHSGPGSGGHSGPGSGVRAPSPDRDDRAVHAAAARSAGQQASDPLGFMNRADAWGGGLRRILAEETVPRREDQHWYAPRYVPIGFARYESPIVDPMDYNYYQMAGWRVAIPRNVPGPERHALLQRIYAFGPQSAGYARLGDTLVPALLGPGDRQTLAQTESRYGAIARKYPYEF